MAKKQPEQTTTIGQIIKETLSERGISQLDLAKALGYSNQSSISERLRGDIRMGTAVKILDYLGYDIVVIDREKARNRRTVKEIPTPVSETSGVEE